MRRRWKAMVAVGILLSALAEGVQVSLEFSYTTSIAGVKNQDTVRLTIDPKDGRLVTVRNTSWKAPVRMKLNEPIQYAHPTIATGFICVTDQGLVGRVAYPRNRNTGSVSASIISKRAVRQPRLARIVAFDSLYSVQACVDADGLILVSNTALASWRFHKLKGSVRDPHTLSVKLVDRDVVEVEVSYTSNGKRQTELFKN